MMHGILCLGRDLFIAVARTLSWGIESRRIGNREGDVEEVSLRSKGQILLY